MEVLEYVASLVVTTVLCFAIVLVDERRLAEDARDRAWPPPSRAAAIVAFGPLCLPVHFWRTRRSFAGTLVGLGFAALVVACDVLVATLIEAIAG